MNPEESMELAGLIRRIHRQDGLTILLIEHHMDVVMDLCEKVFVLNFGVKLADGDSGGKFRQIPMFSRLTSGRDTGVLEINRINVKYGQIHALRDVSLKAEAGEIVAIIGANGAGKSTLMMTLAGLFDPG